MKQGPYEFTLVDSLEDSLKFACFANEIKPKVSIENQPDSYLDQFFLYMPSKTRNPQTRNHKPKVGQKQQTRKNRLSVQQTVSGKRRSARQVSMKDWQARLAVQTAKSSHQLPPSLALVFDPPSASPQHTPAQHPATIDLAPTTSITSTDFGASISAKSSLASETIRIQNSAANPADSFPGKFDFASPSHRQPLLPFNGNSKVLLRTSEDKLKQNIGPEDAENSPSQCAEVRVDQQAQQVARVQSMLLNPSLPVSPGEQSVSKQSMLPLSITASQTQAKQSRVDAITPGSADPVSPASATAVASGWLQSLGNFGDQVKEEFRRFTQSTKTSRRVVRFLGRSGGRS